MSEYGRQEVRWVVAHITKSMGVAADELTAMFPAVLAHYIGDAVAERIATGTPSQSLSTKALAEHLTRFLSLCLTDLPEALELYVTEHDVDVLVFAAQRQRAQMFIPRLDEFVAPRVSGEAVVIALALVALMDQKRQLLLQPQGMADFLGLPGGDAELVACGGLLRWCERLLTRASSA